MLIVPLQAVPNQAVRVQLNGQNCQVNVYQERQGLFLDLLVDNAPMVSGVICQRVNRIVRDAYLGFVGDLMWLDTQGTGDPKYSGIGARYFLAYLTPGELVSP
ncbi:phage baseplate plug family protein [Salmonella enterica subsp. enterica serovar Paratyphi A]